LEAFVNYVLSGLKEYDPRNICFHEAFILEFIKHPTTIELKLDGVFYGGQRKNVELSFHNIKKIEVDNKPAEFPLKIAEFGHIRSLELNDNKAELLIEWCDFRSVGILVRFYFIECDWINIKIIEPEIPPEFQNIKKEDLNFRESFLTEYPFTDVLKFERNPTSVLLCLSGVMVGKGDHYVELLFEGIQRVEVDNEQTDLPLEEATANGRLVTCVLNDNSIELLIQWNRSDGNIPFVRSYFIEFEKVHIKVL
jgi:hypothetical protein